MPVEKRNTSQVTMNQKNMFVCLYSYVQANIKELYMGHGITVPHDPPSEPNSLLWAPLSWPFAPFN